MSGVAVVTGAAEGVGRAALERLASDGFRVVGLDLAFADESDDRRVADVRDRSAIESALADLDQIDVVVSNAAVLTRGAITGVSPEAWQDTLDTNLSATFHLLGITHDRLAAADSGAFVAVSSVHAFSTSPGAAAYAASKAGLLGLVRAAALEFAADGIRVNAVIPGATRTAMLPQSGPEFDQLVARTPLKRIAEPEEIAGAVAFLAGADSSFITGQALTIDGGVLAQLSSE